MTTPKTDPENNPHNFIYKILPDAPPDPFPPQLPLNALDARDGFVHLCTAAQVARTADLFFSARTSLWVVKLPHPLPSFSSSSPSPSPSSASSSSSPASAAASTQPTNLVKFENGFPHLYGTVAAPDVHSTTRFERNHDQTWADSLAISSWLE